MSRFLRRILFAGLLIGLAAPAVASCPTPLTGKDAGGTTQNFGVTVDSNGYCYGNVGIVDGTAAANKLGVNASGQAAIQAPPSLPLPAGAATSANQPTNAAQGSTTSGQTGNLHLGAVTTSSPSYTTGQTDPLSLTTAGALRVDASSTTQPVSGAFWQTTQPVSAASLPLPSGAATATNQTNVIGSESGGAAATQSQLAGAVYNSTPPTLTNGQQSAIQLDAAGNTNVNLKTALPAGTNTIGSAKITDGTNTVPVIAASTAPTSSQAALNVAISPNSAGVINAPDEGSYSFGAGATVPISGAYQTTATSNPLSSGQQGVAQLTQYRALHINLRNASGAEIGTSSSPVQVSLANTGSNSSAVSVTAGGIAASGVSVSGNPLLDGGRAQNAEPTAVSNGQVVAASRDLVGRDIVFPYANKENLLEATATTTGTSQTSVLAAPGSGLYVYITALSCTNSGSSGTTVTFENGSAGSTIYESYAAANGGGFTQSFVTPIGGVAYMSANTALYMVAGAATTTLICNVSGFKGS